MFVSVPHGIADGDDPVGIVRAYAERMAPGSYVIVSHLTRDGHPPEVFARSATPFSYRGREEIERCFDGFELVEPGLVTVTEWRPEGGDASLDVAGVGGSGQYRLAAVVMIRHAGNRTRF